MRLLSTIPFIIFIGLICLTQITFSQSCLEYLSPIYRYETRFVDCPMVSSSKNKRQETSTDMFTIDFKCSIDNKTLCNKVNNVLITAGKFVTATLNLKSVINVDAELFDFCETYGDCGSKTTIIGATRPGRFIPFEDPADGKLRLYPQALFKQMNLPNHPQLGPYDIVTVFNSKVNYWFEGDPLPIGKRVDLLYAAIHEWIHGLGFASAWNDYASIQVLTPIFGPTFTESTKGQFLELIFDKHLILLPSGKPLTTITDELNQFQFSLDMSDDEIIQSFMDSPQFLIAQDMYEKATTHGSIGFLLTPDLPPNIELTQEQILNDVVTLETSLIPFRRGSSVAHVDFETYLNTSDFLMVYTYPKIGLGQILSRAGSTNTTGPIGPKLRALLGTLGYEIKKDYIPPVTLSSSLESDDNNPSSTPNPSNPSNKSNPPNTSDKSNTSNVNESDSSLIVFNLVLSLICITFTYNIYLIDTKYGKTI